SPSQIPVLENHDTKRFATDFFNSLLGDLDAEDHIMSGELNVPAGYLPDWDAYVVKAADIPPDQRDKWVIKGQH
ncbi:hypothetical protein QMZ05_38880, partial [Bradyrhizobium sp. INPA03-11B]|uniref:hypothetical protein n=1 Tax=Bradyrhizobium sp. INPA03-11B TaxID=418598 RepID=UPI00338F9FFD